MSWHRKMLITNVDSEYVYNLGLEKIRYEYEAKRLSVVHRRDSLALYKKLENKIADSSRLAKLIEGAKGPQKDSLEFELGKTRILLDSIQVAIAMLPSALEDLHVLHDKTVKRLDAMTLESAVEGFKFSWFSFGGKVTNNSFTYFNPALPFASQKIDTSFVSYEARIQFSSYRYSPVSYRSLFFDIGLAFGYSDNFDKLKKREISETTEYGTTPGVRSVTRKSNAYQGEYRRDLKKLTIYEDWYQFLFNDNIGAIHVNPEWIMQNEEKPIANLQVGFLMAFKNTKKDAPVVNAELYYKFNDLFKTTDTDYKLFERNNIGIRFTFPIQFKTQID